MRSALYSTASSHPVRAYGVFAGVMVLDSHRPSKQVARLSLRQVTAPGRRFRFTGAEHGNLEGQTHPGHLLAGAVVVGLVRPDQFDSGDAKLGRETVFPICLVAMI